MPTCNERTLYTNFGIFVQTECERGRVVTFEKISKFYLGPHFLVDFGAPYGGQGCRVTLTRDTRVDRA